MTKNVRTFSPPPITFTLFFRVCFLRYTTGFYRFKPVFHLATLFALREAKTRIRHRDGLKLAGEKIRREQVGTVPTFCLFAREQVRQVENGLYWPPLEREDNFFYAT